MAEANRDLLTLIQIETGEAVELVDDIAGTEGVDGLYVGPGDLSADLGHPGHWHAAPVQKAIARTAAAARAHGKLAACHYDLPDDLLRLAEQGVNMFGHFCDIGIFKQAAASAVQRFRESVGPEA